MATNKMASKAEEEVAAVEARPKSQIMKLVTAITAMIIIGAIGGGVAWHFLGNKAPVAEGAVEAKLEPPEPPVYSALEPFVVNLQPEAGEQYLQVAMTLQVSEQTQVDQIKLYMPMIRSRLLVLLSSKGASELTSPDGKNRLAEEIIQALNDPFAPGAVPLGISSVFFTAFVIQ